MDILDMFELKKLMVDMGDKTWRVKRDKIVFVTMTGSSPARIVGIYYGDDKKPRLCYSHSGTIIVADDDLFSIEVYEISNPFI